MNSRNKDKDKEKGQKQYIALDTIVELDVGGRRFKTTLGTLCAVRGTWFWNRFSPESKFAVSPSFGPVFIDRDSAYFMAILNYLRDRKCPPEARWVLLYREAIFYGLTELMGLIESRYPVCEHCGMNALVYEEVPEPCKGPVQHELGAGSICRIRVHGSRVRHNRTGKRPKTDEQFITVRICTWSTERFGRIYYAPFTEESANKKTKLQSSIEQPFAELEDQDDDDDDDDGTMSDDGFRGQCATSEWPQLLVTVLECANKCTADRIVCKPAHAFRKPKDAPVRPMMRATVAAPSGAVPISPITLELD